MKNIKISKLIITLGIFFSLIISFSFIFLKPESIINFNTIFILLFSFMKYATSI